MDTMEQVQSPIQSDVSEALPLEQQLKTMTREELVKFADDLGYKIDNRMKDPTIRDNILRIINDKKNVAAKVNAESLKQTVSEEDPKIEIRFFNMESPGADLEFSFSGPRGLYGKEFTRPDGSKGGNPKGHKKCPRYHLFPGEVMEMAYSVYEHLNGLTFVTHKTVWDTKTGMITGTVPIIKPRFILQPIFSKADLLKLKK